MVAFMSDKVITIGTEPDDDKRIRVEWGTALKRYMDLLGISRKDLRQRLAEDHHIEVSPQTVSNWLTGTWAPRPSVQVAIAAVLHANPRDVFPLEKAS